MYYTIYKITNQIDGKFYIGSHKTKDLNDDYMGSGKYLKTAQEKHGIENFNKEILFVFDTPEAMYAKEAEMVNEDFLATENTYNLKVGGFGGFDYINRTISKEQKSIAGCLGQNSPNVVHIHEHKDYVNILKKAVIARKNSSKGQAMFKGKTHSEQTKAEIGAKTSVYQSGEGNSQFGSMWITDGKENMKIPKDGMIEIGWRKGRTLNRES